MNKKLLVISYSRAQEQTLFISKLITRLQKLRVHEFAEIWWDNEIRTGADWNVEIRAKFESADAFFVLGSTAHFESEYVRQHEWPIIEKRVIKGEARLFWTSYDRPFDSYKTPVNLSQFQVFAPLTEPLNRTDSSSINQTCLTLLSEEIADFLVHHASAVTTGTPARQPTAREIEAAYLDALKNQCAPLVSRDRFLPMHQLYVRLKADERTSEERKAGEELIKQKIESAIATESMALSPKTMDEIISERLQQQAEVEPLPTEASVRFAAENFSGDTLEEIFQRTRFLVVRGGPGSGKTVLCWKIAETLSAAWRQEFDMRPVKTIRKMSNGFGFARLPILIPIRDYAKSFREGGVSLESFIGMHLSKEDSVYAPHFNGFLLQQLKAGRVVVLLDGLDEVPARDRHQIVESFQSFLRDCINPTLAAFEGDPGDVGGNQLVITSRLAGYEHAPITDKAFRHFIIRSFDEAAIEDYCRNWAKMVFSPRTPNHGQRADALVQTILRTSSPTVQELAKNPLLLQVLCELAAPVDAPDDAAADRVRELPRIRAEIYGQAITVMAKRWQLAYDSVTAKNEHVKDLLQPGKIEELLSYVALEMQRQEVLTRATQDQLQGWLELALGKVAQKSILTMKPTEVTQTTSALLDLVRTHVGVISESAPGVFQFHHLTFQEYLAGIASCRTHNGKSWETAEKLSRKIASSSGGLLDQRWREPWLLGFGCLSVSAIVDKKVPAPAAVLLALRAAWQEADADATPEEAALLLASLLFELPDDGMKDLLEQVLRDLVLCYKTWCEAGVSQENARPFVQAMTRMRRRLGPQTSPTGINPFDVIAAKVIQTAPELSSPLARICMDRGWLTRPILAAFVVARIQDQADWGWPLHQGLRRAVLDQDDLEPKAVDQLQMPDASEKMQDRTNYERAMDVWREKKREDSERVLRPALPELPKVQTLLTSAIDQIRGRYPGLLRRIMALCGGFSDLQCTRWAREYADFSLFLQLPDALRTGAINDAPEEFLTRWGTGNTVYNMADYLDQKQGGRSSLVEKLPTFDLQYLSHDPTAALLRILEKSLDATAAQQAKITGLLQELAGLATQPEVAAEAWVALLATGQASPMPEDSAVAERIRWHCGRMVDEFRDPVVRFAHRPKERSDKEAAAATATPPDDLWAVLNRWLPTLPEAEALRVFRLIMQALTVALGEPVKPQLDWEGAPESPMKLALWGEAWAIALAGRSDDNVYSFAKALDELKFGAEPVQVLRQCVAIVTSANIHFVPGAFTDLLPPAVFPSNAAAVDYFCTALQFLCEAAGAFKHKDCDFRASMFNEMTSGLFKRPEHPPLLLMLIADYMNAAKEENFAITHEEFAAMRQLFASNEELAYPLSAEWKLADLLGREPLEPHSSPEADWELAMQLCRSDEVSAADGWKAFTLLLAGHIASQSSHAKESLEDLWLQLESDVRHQPERLGETLAHALTRARSGGLAMSETAAQVIETLAQIKSHSASAALHTILPLVDHATPTETGRLRTWVAKSWQPQIPAEMADLLARHAALLLAEHAAVLEPAWIRPVLDQVLHGDDRSRSRAILLLGGPIIDVLRGTRHRALSAMEADTLKKMATCHFECLATGNDRSLIHCFDDVHFDNPAATCWLLECSHPVEKELTALTYHFGLGTWTSEALKTFTAWIAADSTHWHNAFIIGYGRLAFYQPEAIPESLHNIMQERIESLKVTAHLLPESPSYALVIAASLRAIAETGAVNPHHRATAVLSEDCACLRAGALVGNRGLVKACADIAESGMEWFDTYPEDCWPEIAEHMNNDSLFELLFHWLAEELQTWSKRRASGIRPKEPSDAYSGSVRNALLSILCVMTEQKRDQFVLLAQELKQEKLSLAVYLAEAAVYHHKVRARMAALTLLSRLPNLEASTVAHVVRAALGDDESVRKRAQMLIPHFREFQVNDAFLAEALAKLRGNEPASIVLAYAKLLTSLMHANQVTEPKKRREIMNALRSAANNIRNIRMLSHLAGSGSKESPRQVVNDGRLDQALLAVMAEGYSSFFKNV